MNPIRRFNLVIEILLISSMTGKAGDYLVTEFQSRNRDTFDFKFLKQIWHCFLRQRFQSRNRDTFDFKVFKGRYLI